MNPDQLMAFSSNPENFTEDQWHAIESTKKKLEAGVGDMKQAVEALKTGKTSDKESAEEGEKPKKQKKKTPKNWIQS